MCHRERTVKPPSWLWSACAGLLFAACGGGSADRATEIVVEREALLIAAGREERISADRLVVKNGARIDGTLIVVPHAGAAGEGFTLVVERGDLVVRGAVNIETAAAAREHASVRRNAAAAVQPPHGQKDLLFKVEHGDIHLHSVSSFQAGRGADGATLVVTEPRDAVAVDGSRGGNITFEARVIHIHREEVAEADGSIVLQGPRFLLGYGGKGGSIEIDDAGFASAMPERLQFTAGRGGRSGRLTLLAEVRLPAVNGKIDARGWRIEAFRLGTGGWGGDVVWPVGDGHLFDNLTEVVLRAGDGGNGAAAGGRGGMVSYRSNKAVSARSLPRAFAVTAVSGNGGDADDDLLDFGDNSELPMYVGRGVLDFGGRGGAGGPVQVWGNAGRAGDADHPAGQAGGHVDVRYGHGGRATSTTIYPFGGGGTGGGQTEPLDATGDPTAYAVVGGNGGDGASLCSAGSPRAGGRGGDAGDISIRFGRGGDGVLPGDAGGLDYSKIRFPAVGRGGSGNPAGSNGTAGKVVLEVAAGGRHPANAAIVGANSAVVGIKVETVVAEPEACGAPPDPSASGSWSEVFSRTDRQVSAGTAASSIYTEHKSCAPQQLPFNDPLNPGLVFETASCTWSSDQRSFDGSTLVVQGSSQCLYIDSNRTPHGQTTTAPHSLRRTQRTDHRVEPYRRDELPAAVEALRRRQLLRAKPGERRIHAGAVRRRDVPLGLEPHQQRRQRQQRRVRVHLHRLRAAAQLPL